jgi:hypothetical protein
LAEVSLKTSQAVLLTAWCGRCEPRGGRAGRISPVGAKQTACYFLFMPHDLNDQISLEIGRRVAARLREQPALLQVARDNLARWAHQNADAPALLRCYREWEILLERPLDDICQILETEAEPNRRLRQNSPFPGVLRPTEIWAIKAAIRERHAKTTA